MEETSREGYLAGTGTRCCAKGLLLLYTTVIYTPGRGVCVLLFVTALMLSIVCFMFSFLQRGFHFGLRFLYSLQGKFEKVPSCAFIASFFAKLLVLLLCEWFGIACTVRWVLQGFSVWCVSLSSCRGVISKALVIPLTVAHCRVHQVHLFKRQADFVCCEQHCNTSN